MQPSRAPERTEATRAALSPIGTCAMPSYPQPRRRDTSLMIQLVTEPTVETPILRPLRSSTVLIVPSLRTTSANSSGGPAIAAMPFTGEPLTMNASPGPEPSAMSIASAAIACCSLASPAKLAIWMSSPRCLKMPVRTPTSSGTNENASRPALPTRKVSAEAAVAANNATASNVGIERIVLPVFRRVGNRARDDRVGKIASRAVAHAKAARQAILPTLPSLVSYRIPPRLRRGLVQRQIVPQHHAIILARRGHRDQLLAHVLAHRRRIALQRIAETAAAAGPHDHLGIDRHRHVTAGHRSERVLARQADQIVAELARLAAPQAPGRTVLTPRVLEIPLALDQVAHPHVDAESAAKFARAAGITPQPAALHQHRTLELDPFDRAVAHVALAHRDRRRLAVLRWPPAPAAAFEALHHEAPVGLRVDAEEHHCAAEEAVVAGRHPVRHRLRQRRHDGVDHGRHDRAPARHRRRKARHHDVAFRDDHLEGAERPLVDRGERPRQRLIGDPCPRERARE